jgi:hypothetical protein
MLASHETFVAQTALSGGRPSFGSPTGSRQAGLLRGPFEMHALLIFHTIGSSKAFDSMLKIDGRKSR